MKAADEGALQSTFAKLNKVVQSSRGADGLDVFPVNLAGKSSWPASHGVSVVLCCSALRCDALHCVMLCCAVLCCAVLCCAVLHHAMQHCAAVVYALF